jgi:hypothetical protein
MVSERQRLLELALESLENKRKQIDEEIAGITRELRGGSGKRAAVAVRTAKPAAAEGRKGRGSRFSREERLRRSQRMKAYWDNWRKQRGRQK